MVKWRAASRGAVARSGALVAMVAAFATATPAGVAAPTGADAAPTSFCADVIVYVVRGSGELPQTGAAVAPFNAANPAAGYGDTWDAFDPVDADTNGSSIDAQRVLIPTSAGAFTPRTGTPFLYDYVQKVRERVGGQLRLSWSPVRYPAIPVEAGSLPRKGLWALRGYPASVTSGIQELDRTLKRQWELCGTKTRYVLAGYSQGADVVNSYLRGKLLTRSSTFGIYSAATFLGPNAGLRKQIAAVSLVADPNHDTRDPESYSDQDGRLSQRGGLTGYREGIPTDLAALTDSICLAGDVVCGQGANVLKLDTDKGTPIHTRGYRDFVTYPVSCKVGDRRPDDVSATTCLADRAVERLGLRNLVLDPLDESRTAPGTTGRDVVFFLDTTGSMSDDIDAAREFARNEADRIIGLDGRVGLVQYRDAGDDVPVEIVTQLTTDIDAFRAGLDELFADGGGDEPEALLHALMHGFNGLDWQLGATKAVVILTDASFHEPDQVGGEALPEVERRSLEIDPVNVFPVVSPTEEYRELAERTSGEVIDNTAGNTEEALSIALDRIADRPVAVLTNATYVSAPGRAVHFDASGSSTTTGTIVDYRWDLDGDGETDDVTTEPVLDHQYAPGHTGVMQVVVTDTAGRSANASAAVVVAEDAEPVRSVPVPKATSMQSTGTIVDDHVQVDVTWSTQGARPDRWMVSLDGDPIGLLDGKETQYSAAVEFREDPWVVTLTPMSDSGFTGREHEARLGALPEPDPWWQRPIVWVAGAVAGIVLFGAVLAVLLGVRRRRRTVPDVGPALTGTR